MKKARAPGGGRKPKRPAERSASWLQARITDDLRARLEDAAAESGRKLSEEARLRLQGSFDLPEELQKSFGTPEIRYLAQLIAKLVGTVQRSTGADPFKEATDFAWHRNAYTHTAVCTAINILLTHFKPEGPVEIPEAVKPRAAWVDPSQAELVTTPESVGQSCALGLIDQLTMHTELPSVKNILAGSRYGENYHLFPRINSVLGKPNK